mmetsp:Transcript_37590/g.52192  ORF Transcript_37590/g.52192 Transcript_37590/m.52192 type:complete len:343 (-) Transcript_37590:14-1042(-)
MASYRGFRQLFTFVLLSRSLISTFGIEITSPPNIKGFYTHYRVESSHTLSASPIIGQAFVPSSVKLPNGNLGSDIPDGGVMVLTKEQYGFDPQDWVITVSNFNVKAILLIEEENVLYRRWDPYTEFNGVNSVPAIPVLQVTLDTGLKILEALMIGNPVDFRLYTAPADVEEFQILKQLYETAIRDGTTTFFVNGWFQMSAEDPASLGADPCLQMWAGVDCNEQGKISHLQLRAMNASGIPAQIGNLKNLTTLYLRDCIFHHWTGGNSIPLSIGYLEKLMLLRVEDAELDGSIPESLGLLSDLKFLLLSRNHLRGVLPTTLMNLALEELDLSFNDLSGTIPVV